MKHRYFVFFYQSKLITPGATRIEVGHISIKSKRFPSKEEVKNQLDQKIHAIWSHSITGMFEFKTEEDYNDFNGE